MIFWILFVIILVGFFVYGLYMNYSVVKSLDCVDGRIVVLRDNGDIFVELDFDIDDIEDGLVFSKE